MTVARTGAYLAVVVAVLLAATACWSDDASVPTHLADGSEALVAEMPFEGVSAPVLMAVARPGSASLDGCGQRGPRSLSVERVGLLGSSVTRVSRDRRSAWACDSTMTQPDCGQAFGRMGPQGVLDPRLSLTCRDTGDTPLGFLWIQSSPGAAYVIVDHDAYAEAYPVLGTGPVRIATSDVDEATSSAHVAYSEHTLDGERIRSATIEAQVSD